MLDGDAAAAAVVAVDIEQLAVGVGAGPARAAADDGGQADPAGHLGQRVAVVEGEQQGAVDVAAGQVAADALVVLLVLDEQQHHLVVGGGQLAADPAQVLGEERVGEEPALGLGHDDGDGAVAPGDQGAGGEVGDVAEFVHGLLHLGAQGLAYARAAVHDAGGGRAGDPGTFGDGLQGGARERADGLLLGHRWSSRVLLCRSQPIGWGGVLRALPRSRGAGLARRACAAVTATSDFRQWGPASMPQTGLRDRRRHAVPSRGQP